MDVGEEVCACLIDWQKEFDRVNWTNLMQILKDTGIFCRERGFISSAQSVKSTTGSRKSDECELEELDTDAVLL